MPNKDTLGALTGYGLFSVFYYTCALWSKSASVDLLSGGYGFFHQLLRAAILIGYLVGFIIVISPRNRSRRPLLIAMTVSLLVGIISLALMRLAILQAPVLSLMVALGFGLAAAFGNICWIEVLAGFDVRLAQLILATGTMAAALLYLGVGSIATISSSAMMLAMLVCVIIAQAILLLFSRHWNTSANDSDSRNTGATVTHYLSLFAVLAPAIVCCAFVQMLQPIIGALTVGIGSISVSFNLAWSVGSIFGAITILLIWHGKGFGISVPEVFIMAVPTIAIVVFLFPFVDPDYWAVFVLLSELLRTVVVLSVTAACLSWARDRHADPLVLYTVFALLMIAFDFIGGVLGSLINEITIGSPTGLRLSGLLYVFLALVVLFSVHLMRKHAPVRESTVADGKADRDAKDPEGEEALRQIATRYGLTPRETDVLILQAKGRSVPFIASKLYLSQETVRSHVKHIHQALDVHTQQELIDLVDEQRDIRL